MSKKSRRTFSADFKAQVGLEALIGVEPVHTIAAKHEVHPVQVSQWKKEVLERLPEIFNTDQGSQFTRAEFTGVLQEHGVKISMDGRGRCLDNVFVERLWRSVKYEEVYLRLYVNLVEAERRSVRLLPVLQRSPPPQRARRPDACGGPSPQTPAGRLTAAVRAGREREGAKLPPLHPSLNILLFCPKTLHN